MTKSFMTKRFVLVTGNLIGTKVEIKQLPSTLKPHIRAKPSVPLMCAAPSASSAEHRSSKSNVHCAA